MTLAKCVGPGGIAAILVLTLGCQGGSGGDEDTPSDIEPSEWWNCPQQIGGAWSFGRAPYGCAVSEFASPQLVRSEFDSYIFDDLQPRDTERNRYMEAFYSFLANQAAEYLRSRRPDAGSQEVRAWRHAIYATAHQESFWTHYRHASTTDGHILTMLRGDSGHGHGLMQVDDRFHTEAIQSGVGWRLDENLIYALDIYYNGWQRAPDQWCVSAPDAWAERARAAYSAYNGGPAKICRWTNPDSPWHQNDEGFYDKYIREDWQYYVAG